MLAGVLFTFYFYYLAVNQHLIPFLSDVGYSDAQAAARFGSAVGLGLLSKLAIGLLADRIPGLQLVLRRRIGVQITDRNGLGVLSSHVIENCLEGGAIQRQNGLARRAHALLDVVSQCAWYQRFWPLEGQVE